MVQLDETTYHELLAERSARDEKLQLLEAENAWLREQLLLNRHRLFAPKSEKTQPTPQSEPGGLFNEAEVHADPAAAEPTLQTITYTRRKKKTLGQRDLQLQDLEVEVLRYELPPEEQVCPQCCGALHAMGEDVRRELKFIPARAVVVEHVQCNYACRHCQQEALHTPVVRAPMPAPAFPNSLASPSAVAAILTHKYVEGLPLYRQEQAFARLGL